MIKVKFSPALIKLHFMYGGLDKQLYTFLTSSLERGEWWASGPDPYIPGGGGNPTILIRQGFLGCLQGQS
jgi:hypothetical protein